MKTYGVKFNFSSNYDSINSQNTANKIQIYKGNNSNCDQSKEKYVNGIDENDHNNQLGNTNQMGDIKSNSPTNRAFAALLALIGIPFKPEFNLDSYFYDFKINNYLIELDPSATHNTTWSPYGKPISETYHREKSLCAIKHNYTCIHIFDWTNIDYVLYGILAEDIHPIDTGKCVRHIFDIKKKMLTNIETPDTVIIYDDGFEY